MAERDYYTAPPDSPVIYTGWSGFEIKKFSYSQAMAIAGCGLAFKLKRIGGWDTKADFGRLRFGDAIETAVRSYYDGQDAVKVFAREWKQLKETPMVFGKREGSWFNMLDCGKELMRELDRVYKAKKIGLVDPEFQITYPLDENDTWYNGTQLEYRADGLSHPKHGKGRRTILVDIKTSANSYPDSADNPKFEGIVALDNQLRTGALASGIPDVAFLVFVKTKNPKIQWLTGKVTEEYLEEVDSWLKAQYHKVLDREFQRRPGIRFPSDHCKMCDVLPVCLGNLPLAKETLHQKQKKDAADQFSAMDELDPQEQGE